MAELDLVLRGRRVLLPDGERPAALGVRDGVVVAVERFDAELSAARVEEYGDGLVLLPGLVDSHVHLQDPGRPGWEGFDSGTAAAAAGGVTTVVDMPVDSVPATVDAAGLRAKLAAARGRCWVDVGFWGGLGPEQLVDGAPAALAAAGVLGFKAFLADPGAPDLAPLPAAELPRAGRAVAALAPTSGALPLLVHAELPGPAGPSDAADRPVTRYAEHLDRHPAEHETGAVAAVLLAARQTGCRMHVVHLTTAEAARMVGAARAEGVPVSAETCPHLLCLAAEEVPDGGTEYLVGPPLRERREGDGLWAALVDGALGCVVSDHSPSGAGHGHGDFATAAPGIASLELGLPLVWTAARQRGLPLSLLVRWMSAGPAALAGLPGKGALAVGRDADVVVFDPDARFTVRPEALRQRQSRTPYAGRELTGVVRRTWLRGVPVDETGPRGLPLLRGARGGGTRCGSWS